MTPEAQRIAIAEACGWKRCELYRRPPSLDELEPTPFLRGMPPNARGDDPFFRMLPDYLVDLNAIHEAEMVLDDKIGQCRAYADCIMEDPTPRPSRFGAIHSPAAERAKAFLRTLGKWQDGT